MKFKNLNYLVAVGLTACLTQYASAQDDLWNGLGGDGLWMNGANWSLGYPPPDASGLTNGTGNVIIGAVGVGNGWPAPRLLNGEVANPGIHTEYPPVHSPWNTIYGPEFGAGLECAGSLSWDWIMAPVQPDPVPANRNRINIRGNGKIQCDYGAALGIADQWWYWAAPFVTVNMYDNSYANMTNGAGLWVGGHLNLYDSATFYLGINGYVNMDVRGALNDGTRGMTIGGGRIVLPTGWTNAGAAGDNSGTVYDWIARGILRAYGKALSSNDFVITDDGTNTIVTTVPLGGALQRIYFQPLLRSTVEPGNFQQLSLVGDYPSVSGVLLSSWEPGLNPALIGQPTYTSSDTSVATVDTNGMVTAVGVGSTTLSASLGAFNSTNTLTLTVVPASSTLLHRYSFNEPSGTSASDSVGGATAMLQGTAAFNGAGQVVLDGNTNGQNYVLLPAGIVSNLDEITIEAWVSLGATTTNNFENIFSFGTSITDPLDPNFGAGGNLIALSPHNGTAGTTLFLGQGLPGFEGERDAAMAAPLDGNNNLHVVAVYHPYSGTESLYTNGVLATSITIFNNMIDPVACLNQYGSRSIINYTLGAVPSCYIGKSQYAADPGLLGSIDEFRIYDGALTASQVAADNALGPSALIGTSMASVTLSAVPSGNNVVISWPTTSAMVTLLSTPALGPNAVWTPVTSALTASGGFYHMTVPNNGGTRYFRLTL